MVNSSFSIFFLLFLIFWASIAIQPFPEDMQTKAFFAVILFSLLYYVLIYIIKQLESGVTVLRLIVVYFFILAGLTIINAWQGPVSTQTVPVIDWLIRNIYFSSSVRYSFIDAGVFFFYVLITFIIAILSAMTAEFFYVKASKYLPKKLKKRIVSIDSSIDNSSIEISDKFFIVDETKGLIAASLLLAGFFVVYCSIYFIF
mgnify:FL=1